MSSTSDEFFFYHHSQNGEVDFEVFVEDFVSPHELAKGGIMIRDALTPGSAHFSLLVTAGGAFGSTLSKQWRTCDGCSTNDDDTYSDDDYGFISPVEDLWLKVTKIGNTFQAYYKFWFDGEWSPFGSAETMQFSSDYFHVGIAVTSGDNSKTAELLWRYNEPTEFGRNIGMVFSGLPGRVTPSATGGLIAKGSGSGVGKIN